MTLKLSVEKIIMTVFDIFRHVFLLENYSVSN